MPIQIPAPGYKDENLKEKNGESAIFQMFIQQPVLDIVHMQTKLGIPDGATAIIEAGNELRQTKVEDTGLLATVLDWVGICDNISYTNEPCTTILMVTPRIIIREEREEVFSGRKTSVRPQGN